MGPARGDTICGRIRIESEGPQGLGSPAFGPIRIAHVPELGPQWLTVIDRSFLPSAVALSRFMASANALMDLRHPALVRVALVDREADFCVVGFDALPGALALADLGPGRAQALVDRCAVELARGLAFLHRHERVHGALSPGTIWVWEGVPMLGQYGLAELCDRGRWAGVASALGLETVAPEVSTGTGLTPRADVFAWGRVIAALGPTDARLQALVQRAIDPDPARRPSDGSALLGELQRAPQGPVLPRDALVQRYVQELDGNAEFEIDAGLAQPRAGGPDLIAAEDPFLARFSPEPAQVDTPVYPAVGPPLRPIAAASSESLARPLAEDIGVRSPGPASVPFSTGRLELDHSLGPSLEKMASPGPVDLARGARASSDTRSKRGGATTFLLVGGAVAAIAFTGWLVRDRRALDASPPEVVPSAVGGASPESTMETVESAVASPRTSPRRCPDDMVAIASASTRLSCIEIGEYPGLREIPRTSVTLKEAEALCAERGRRLCGRTEWVRACAGGNGQRAFPYGDPHEQDRCNEASASGVPQNLSRAGARDGCVTAEGAYDLAGNVAEWVHEGVVMGGDATSTRPGCRSQRRLAKTSAQAAVGFRCCLSLE